MSAPPISAAPATPQPDTALDPWHGILYSVVDQIIPLFMGPGRDREYARAAALSAIAAYHPESRADYANIGRTIAFSLAAIAALGKAAATDLPPTLALRYLTKAAALHRSAEQSERTMVRRQHDRRNDPQATQADYLIGNPEARPAAPTPDPEDAAITAAIDEAMAEFRATQSKAAAEPPQPKPAQQVAIAGQAAVSALRHPFPGANKPAILQPSLKQSLMHRTVMPRTSTADELRQTG